MGALRLLKVRDLYAASVTVIAVWADAEERLPPGSPPVAMGYKLMSKHFRARDPLGFGARLENSPDPDHMMRRWVQMSIKDGVLEPVQRSRPVAYVLTDKGREAAGLRPLAS